MQEATEPRPPPAARSRPSATPRSADGGKSFPNDACFKYQWHLRQIGMPAAWKQGNGKGAVVAVIDTGVTKVGDLADTKFVPGYNFVANNANADDDHGHGTHVAGTIAESTNNGIGVAGVAYGASIMPLKVLSARGSGSMGGIAQAIRWAADHGANVINMSLGGPFAVSTLASAVKYAHGKGVVVVAAAGNDGRGKVGYPARYPGVIAVGGHAGRRGHDLLFELGPGGRHRRRRAATRAATRRAASCSTRSSPATSATPTTSTSWGPRWPRRTWRAWPRWWSAPASRSPTRSSRSCSPPPRKPQGA